MATMAGGRAGSAHWMLQDLTRQKPHDGSKGSVGVGWVGAVCCDDRCGVPSQTKQRCSAQHAAHRSRKRSMRVGLHWAAL